VEHERWGTPVASYVAGLPPDARPLDRGKPRDEDTEGGSQPADKSLINRRLSLHSQPCAAMAFLADGELAEQALNRASPLDREHKSSLESRASRKTGRSSANRCVLIVGPRSERSHLFLLAIIPDKVPEHT
jgi:hypothetical protein